LNEEVVTAIKNNIAEK